MLERPPTLLKPVVLAIVAGVALVYAYRMEPGPLSDAIALAGVVLALAALVSGVDYIWHRGIWHYQVIQRARAETPSVLMLRAIQGMTPEQLSLANSMQMIINFLPGEPAPTLYAVQIGEVSIPFDFVKAFIALSDDAHLPPVRQWPEGSLHRQYAVYLTNHLILMGYASPASGNMSARWKNRYGAMRSLGLIEPEDETNNLVTIDYLNRLAIKRERAAKHAQARAQAE